MKGERDENSDTSGQEQTVDGGSVLATRTHVLHISADDQPDAEGRQAEQSQVLSWLLLFCGKSARGESSNQPKFGRRSAPLNDWTGESKTAVLQFCKSTQAKLHQIFFFIVYT